MEQDGQVATRIVVRPLASGLPLGFLAFSLGMLMLAGVSLSWVPVPALPTAGLILAAFVAPAEFLAAVLAALARDTGAAVSLGLFSTSWLALGLNYLAGGGISAATGLYLVGFSVVLLILATPALMGRPLLGAILLLAAVRGAFAAVYQFGGPPGWSRLADGVIALVIVTLGWYAGLAFLLEEVQNRTVLPTGRRGPARQAFDESRADSQLQDLPRQAGIRRQL
ncbi:MAG: GPR1/FUN34/YaaH family transporter [Pseudonocardia sp.]|nr:GPR1/FUN34/YaaH family transporter [Pseudonocardia sp.]